MDRITGVMMSLLTGQVCGGEPPLPALTADEAAHLYALSKTYDLAHLTGSALLHRGLLPDGPLRAAFEKQVLLAVYRCETQGSDLAQLDALLTHGQIPFLPLKGSVLRQYYPQRHRRAGTPRRSGPCRGPSLREWLHHRREKHPRCGPHCLRRLPH